METTQITCTGNVTRHADFPNTPTDSNSWRSVDVSITRCNACAGSAVVRDGNGNSWIVALPEHDYRTDDAGAAYWAAEVSAHRMPTLSAPIIADIDVSRLDGEGDEWVEDEDGSEAFARMLERRSDPY